VQIVIWAIHSSSSVNKASERSVVSSHWQRLNAVAANARQAGKPTTEALRQGERKECLPLINTDDTDQKVSLSFCASGWACLIARLAKSRGVKVRELFWGPSLSLTEFPFFLACAPALIYSPRFANIGRRRGPPVEYPPANIRAL